MSTIVRVLRSMAAVVGGYFVMVVLITLVQETWLGGVSWQRSSPGVLFVAGTFTFLAAVVGGLVAGLVAGRSALAHGLLMCGIALIETTVLILTGRVEGPLWFDLMAAGSLLVGILLGALLHRFRFELLHLAGSQRKANGPDSTELRKGAARHYS